MTAYEHNTLMSKHTSSTLMLSKTNVMFSDISGRGYITADMIMVLSNLKEPIKRIKAGRVR